MSSKQEAVRKEMGKNEGPWTDEWILYTVDLWTREYYLSIKKNKILLFVTQMEPQIIMLREINQAEKNK